MINPELKLPLSLSQALSLCQGTAVIGDDEVRIVGFCSIDSPRPYALAFVANEKFLKQVDNTLDVVYLVKPEWRDSVRLGIVHENPKQAFRLILAALSPARPAQIADSAKIAQTARIGKDCHIGEYSVIEDNAVIGDNCAIGNHTTIGQNAVVGVGSTVGHRVSIHHDCLIGKSCVISDGAVVGDQGFGFNLEAGAWKAIPQIGRVIVGDAVHIGNNSCIDRGAIDDTVIANNVIIDNLVHIAHNVHIGAHSAMAAGVGVAGSTKVGEYCLLGGKVGVVGHINICDGVHVNGGARVLKSIAHPGAYAGSFHAMPASKWNRLAIYFKQLDKLFARGKKK